jgi:tRNA U34 5-methylaminomethyl-2-thiouridine-forming methyltransferase MnmC
MDCEIIQTADGSKSIYLPHMGENYHSIHGALQEARHVYIQNGLETLHGRKQLDIFEMGFGTGLNTLLTLEHAKTNFERIKYTSIEAFPLSISMANMLEYERFVDLSVTDTFKRMHTCKWNEPCQLTTFFVLNKLHLRIEIYVPEPESFDLIYFDAFGPKFQEKLWDLSILYKMYTMLRPEGVFVTYCAKGQLKRDLKSLGFHVQTLNGPPGKREMIRAIKI